jgi:hypothetical protein
MGYTIIHYAKIEQKKDGKKKTEKGKKISFVFIYVNDKG